MKKRIFSLVLALAMMVSVSTAFAAQPQFGDEADDFYEGNKPFVLMETLLDALNEDKEANLFDDSEHDAQFTAIETLNLSLASLTADDLGTAITHITNGLTVYQKQYLVALTKAYGNDGITIENSTIANALKSQDTSGKSLKESFGLLDNYVDEMQIFFNQQGINANDYSSIEAEAKKYIAEPLIAILKIMFAQDGTAESYDDSGKYMRENYFDKFLTQDRAKKTLAVLFGADLTEEIVSDSANDGRTRGIVYTVKNYLTADPSRIPALIEALEPVMVAGNTSVDAAFDVIGKLVSDAYAGKALHGDVTMLMGDGTTPGLVELLIKSVDNNLTASNIWVNLFLSEFAQLSLPGGEASTISQKTPTPANVTIYNNASVNFKIKNLSDYGVNNGNFRNTYFNVVCYNEDGTVNSNVTYDGVKFTVNTDQTKGSTYKAYLQLYRGSSSDTADTFIESYPVLIQNYTTGGGGGGSSKVYITYNTNGGEAISSTSHTRGSVVHLNKVPVREGYIFTGWYSDAALTQKIDSVTVTASTTVYAGWKKDGSAVVSVVDIPELLEGEHHYAYIMGYPEGDVRPYGNITRAETVTMVFRLLKDSVRTSNLTETNSFYDVNESDWFNTAVSTLAGMGIVEGRTETEFMPNANITRAEFATIFARLAEFDAVEEQSYGDVDRHWAEEHIYEASSYGWIAGYEDNTFKPDKAINRAEAMTLVNRVLKRVPESKEDLLDGMNVWSDNADTTAWYYLAIQEATNSHDHVMKNAAYEKWTALTENKDWTVFEK